MPFLQPGFVYDVRTGMCHSCSQALYIWCIYIYIYIWCVIPAARPCILGPLLDIMSICWKNLSVITFTPRKVVHIAHYNDVIVSAMASHQWRLDGLLNRMLRRSSKKTSKLRVTGLCDGNSPVTGEFPSQRVSNTEMFPFDVVIMFCVMLLLCIPSCQCGSHASGSI